MLKNADYVKVFARRFGIGQRSFIGPGSEKKWYSSENSPQGAWDNIAEEMLLEFAESGQGQGDGVPKAGVQQAAADSRGSPNLRVCKHLSAGWHTQGEKDELTSCRGTV